MPLSPAPLPARSSRGEGEDFGWLYQDAPPRNRASCLGLLPRAVRLSLEFHATDQQPRAENPQSNFVAKSPRPALHREPCGGGGTQLRRVAAPPGNAALGPVP